MPKPRPVLFWFRRDLRLVDHPGLTAALSTGAPVLPVFILDPETEATGAAAAWRLGQALATFRARLRSLGSDLVLRRGRAGDVLRDLVAETGAVAVHWTRLYAPDWVTRDRGVKAVLRAAGIEAQSHPGFLLNEPWSVATGTGDGYRVFTPFWRAAARLVPEAPLPAVTLPPVAAWPASDRLEDWRLDAAVNRGGAVLARHARVGEAAAEDRLAAFLAGPVAAYGAERDRPDRDGTSQLSECLTWGEISPRRIWHAASWAAEAEGPGAAVFLRQLYWREFAWHLMWHAPDLAEHNWRREWDTFPWRGDNPAAERWRRGLTGEPMVDAGMRELYVTGRMHNRVRMVVASYLCKHLVTDWRIGLAWFAECLTDWDPAANALNWQWVAGSGPDAAPYFRVFNPGTQAETYDPDGLYRQRFLAESADKTPGKTPGPDAMAFFEAAPRRWELDPGAPYPAPVVDRAAGRQAALAAYAEYRDRD